MENPGIQPNENNPDEPTDHSSVGHSGSGIDFLDYLFVVMKHKKMVLKTCVVAVFLTSCVALLLPNIYTATALILPPQQETSDLATMLGNAGDIAALAGLQVNNNSGDLYLGLLQSRSVADAIIDKFDLMQVYDEEFRVKAYQALRKYASVSQGRKDGIIAITVNDEDPERAAAIANAYVDEIKKFNVRLNLSNAGRERAFIEDRLAVAKSDLLRAEESLKEFQEKNNAIEIDAQAEAIIDSIASLKGELASKEVELGVLLVSHTEQKLVVKIVRRAINELKAQISKLEQSPTGEHTSGDIFIPTAKVPELRAQYVRYLRDVKIQETLFELLTKQYEMAKIREAKNISTIQVIDEAVPPDRQSSPKRLLIIILVALAAGMSAILGAFVKEFTEQMPEGHRQRWTQVKEMASRWRREGNR